jgi:voltage-gated potassium channel
MVLIQLIRMYRRIRSRRSLGFGLVAGILVVGILGNALTFWLFDRGHHEGLTVEDALWYSIISITTIGYGDYYAHSIGARIGTIVFVVIVGLGAFSTFFGMVIDLFTSFATRGVFGLGKVMARDHILIVHFPAEARVRQIIDEIRSDAAGASEIVVVANDVERLPFQREGVLFIRGSTHEVETFERAGAMQARAAIVLSRDYSDPHSDAVVAAAVSVLDRMKPELHIVAECLDDSHRELFQAARCDAIISGMRIAGNLLVQEGSDPGISQLVQTLTSNCTKETLFSAVVDPKAIEGGLEYLDLAKRLLDRGVNMIAVARGDETITDFVGAQPRPDDRLIYVAEKRRTCAELVRS